MGMVYTWLAVAVLAIVVEVIVPGLVAIWFVPSALVAMLLSFISVPVGIQIVAFLVASVVFIFLSRKFISIKGQKNKTNIDAVVGERCIVTERIDNIHGTGKDSCMRIYGAFVCNEGDDFGFVKLHSL